MNQDPPTKTPNAKPTTEQRAIMVSDRIANFLDGLLAAPGCPHKDYTGLLADICQTWVLVMAQNAKREPIIQVPTKPHIVKLS